MKKKCRNCGFCKFEYKSIYFPTKDIQHDINESIATKILDILPTKTELFYVKICTNCAKVDFFNAKIINENNEKIEKENILKNCR